MKAGRVEGLDAAAPLRPNAARIIQTRIAELHAQAVLALDPSASKAQHDTRIAAKRVRYLLEIAGDCFGPEARAALDAAKDLQGTLGDLHDCDVLLAQTAGIPSLEDVLRARRDRHFQHFREGWLATGESGTWTALLGELQDA